MYIHIYVHMYAYIYMYIYMYRRIHRGPASGYTYRHLRIDMHIQTYTLIPRYIYLQVTAGLSHTRRASNMHMYTRQNELSLACGCIHMHLPLEHMHVPTHACTTLLPTQTHAWLFCQLKGLFCEIIGISCKISWPFFLEIYMDRLGERGKLQWAAVCCSELQWAAVCCSELQCLFQGAVMGREVAM